MGIVIELTDQDYKYCLDYANGKTNIFALNNTSRVIKAVANGTRYEKTKRDKMGDKELGKVTRYLMAAVLVMWAIAAIIGIGKG